GFTGTGALRCGQQFDPSITYTVPVTLPPLSITGPTDMATIKQPITSPFPRDDAVHHGCLFSWK
ncbi:Phospholipase A2 inhibitor subunit gamma B, partial [Clarias magur]